jgi:hypothetical protein
MTWRAVLSAAGVVTIGGGWIAVTLARQLHAWARDNDLFAEQYARRAVQPARAAAQPAPAIIDLTKSDSVRCA